MTAAMSEHKFAYMKWNGTTYFNVIDTKNIISGDKVEGNDSVTAKWQGRTYAATIIKLGK